MCGINPVLAARYAICTSHAPAKLRSPSKLHSCTFARASARESERILQERATLATFLCVCVIDRNSNRIVDFSRDIGYLGFDRSPFAFLCVFIRNNNYYLYQKT